MPNLRELPLQSLRTFQIAARHDRFSEAAKELGLTPSAVSHQILALEARLGSALFDRGSRGVCLTLEGKVLSSATDEAGRCLDDACQHISALNTPNQLRISCVPAYAAVVLAGRIGDFEAGHPELDVRLEVSSTLDKFGRNDADCGIRYGPGEWPGLEAIPLGGGRISLVCASAFADSVKAKVRGVATIELAQRPDAWPELVKSEAVPKLRLGSITRAESLIAGLQMAEAGLGVLMLPDALADPLVTRGRLVRWSNQTITDSHDYYLVFPRSTRKAKTIKRFQTWLMTSN